jgi:hypothetical protein
MRTLLIAAMIAGSAAAAGQAVKPGVERWSIKTSVPGGASKAQTAALADLIALKDVDGIKKNDSRYQSARIPAQPGARLTEGDLLTTTGYLHLVASETDGDYHIQISASADSGDNCLIVEVPNPDPAFVKTTSLQPEFEAVRTFIKTKLLAGKEPSTKGSVMQHRVFVTVTGVLFYDDSHVGDPPRGKKGMLAATLWELHPVTAIAFAPAKK